MTVENKTVLIVDDSLSVRLSLKNILASERISVVEASDGKQALGILKSSSVKINFIICDFNMPVMDGPVFIKAARLLPDYRFVKILVLTGTPTDANKDAAKKSGATAWMTKPYTQKSIVDVVKKFA